MRLRQIEQTQDNGACPASRCRGKPWPDRKTNMMGSL